jgi:MFS transporter, DHA1 family, inner membrane transport protein
MASDSTIAAYKEPPKSEKRSLLILLALAISAFSIGTTEFVMAGVLPDIARTFAVSIPAAGWLMTGYAVGVSVSAPILTAMTIRMPRKHVLIGLMGLFIIGNVIAAMAPTYNILMAGRVISALCHGAFFGVGSVVAANAVSPDKRARALALMFTGLTLANVIGVPMGTLLGQNFGWRSMFWVISCLGAISMVGIIALIPYKSVMKEIKLSHELDMFKRPQVWLSLLVTAMGFGGVFASFAYVAPIMTNIAGFAESNVVWLLFLFGAGLVLGNIIGGKAGDHALVPSIYLFLIMLAAVLFIFVFTAHYKIPAAITLFLLGMLGFALVSPVQMQVVQAAKDAPTLASAANISAFNVGIATGTYLGGLTIHLGFGYTSVNWVGGILTLVGLLMQVVNIVFIAKRKI